MFAELYVLANEMTEIAKTAMKLVCECTLKIACQRAHKHCGILIVTPCE